MKLFPSYNRYAIQSERPVILFYCTQTLQYGINMEQEAFNYPVILLLCNHYMSEIAELKGFDKLRLSDPGSRRRYEQGDLYSLFN